MDTSITLLAKLGCGTAEAETFLTLFAHPEGLSVVELQKKRGLPRPTLYGHLAELMGRNLVKRGISGRGARFWAENAAGVASAFAEKADELELARVAIARTLPAVSESSRRNPKLFTFDGTRAAEAALRDIVRSREKQVYSYWPVKDMLKTIPPKAFEQFHRDRIARGMYLRTLWPHGQKVDPKKYPQLVGNIGAKSLREIRVLPSGVPVLVGYLIYGNRVAFIGTKRDPFSFVVESPDITATLKSQFDYWWSVSTPVKE